MQIQNFLKHISDNKIDINLPVTLFCINKYCTEDYISNKFIEYRKGILYGISMDNYYSINSGLTVGTLIEMLQEEYNKSIELCMISDYQYFKYTDCCITRDNNNDKEHFAIIFKEIKKPKILIDEDIPDNETIRGNYLGDLEMLYNKTINKIA